MLVKIASIVYLVENTGRALRKVNKAYTKARGHTAIAIYDTREKHSECAAIIIGCIIIVGILIFLHKM